jgi:hypothetical protein
MTETEGSSTTEIAPFHLGGVIDGEPQPVDMSRLTPGRHIVVAEIYYVYGTRTVASATFRVTDQTLDAEAPFVGSEDTLPSNPEPTAAAATTDTPTTTAGETPTTSTIPGDPTAPQAPESTTTTTTTAPGSGSGGGLFFEAERYVASRDLSRGNLFTGDLKCTLRRDDVDLKAIGRERCSVGHFETGEWLEYRVPPGDYKMRLRVFSADSGRVRIESRGQAVTNPVTVPNTSSDWSDVQWIWIETPVFRAGSTIRVVSDADWWDFDRFELVPGTISVEPTTTTTTTTTNPPGTPTTTTTRPPTTTTNPPGTPTTTTTRPPTTTTTTTTNPPTTTTTTTRPPTPPGFPGPSGYGAGSVGPGREPCETDGIVVDGGDYPRAINNADAGSTVLIRGGTYGEGFAIPAGTSGNPTIVKPYNCENVTINAGIGVDSWTTVAGLRLNSPSTWAIRVHRDSGTAMTNVVVRNNKIRGGNVEAIRISRNVRNIDITGNDLDGGRKNHVIKVHWENSSWRPTNINIVNNVFHKNETGSGEDLLQLEGHHTVLVERNTFRNVPNEDGVDIKAAGPGGGATLRRNYFDGSSIRAECLLVQGTRANTIIENNYFDNGCQASLGAHPENGSLPWWRFRNNIIDNGELRLRRSEGAEILNNTMQGGTLKLGLGSGDHPRNAIITGNTFTNVDLIDRVTDAGDTYTCTNNTLTNVTGDWSACR